MLSICRASSVSPRTRLALEEHKEKEMERSTPSGPEMAGKRVMLDPTPHIIHTDPVRPLFY